MKHRVDTTDASSYGRMRALVTQSGTERETQLAGRFRIHMVGMYYCEVGPEWGSGGRMESDYLHHMDLGISGHRQVVCDGRVHEMAPGQVWFLPGNTPVERRCSEACEVLFFKFHCEWLPGVDPLLDWTGRGPRLAGLSEESACRSWLEPDAGIGVSGLLRLRGHLLSWIASAVPELDQIVSRHLESHTQFSGVFDVIEQNLGADLRLPALARAYGTTVEAFSMAFSRCTGSSPKDYLTRRLNQEALQLVINTDMKMKEIAARLRFSDEFYFSRFFQKLNGCPPTQYRRKFLGKM